MTVLGRRRVAEDEVATLEVRGFDGEMIQAAPFDLSVGGEIAAHWRRASAGRPQMFDGRVLLAVDCWIEDGLLRARHAEVAFSAFNWWRAAAPPGGLRNVFGAGAVVSADGAALVGRMAPGTAAAGLVYFPCGTPDLDDVADGRVDLDRSIEREIAEETGLGEDVLVASELRIAVFVPKVAAYVRRYDCRLPAAELLRRVEDHLAGQAAPELDRVMTVRSPDELGDSAPPYMRLALPRVLG
jgi:hypothetical protein